MVNNPFEWLMNFKNKNTTTTKEQMMTPMSTTETNRWSQIWSDIWWWIESILWNLKNKVMQWYNTWTRDVVKMFWLDKPLPIDIINKVIPQGVIFIELNS